MSSGPFGIGDSISKELVGKIVRMWMEAAVSAGLSLAGFDPKATLDDRLTWARAAGLDIGAAYSRFSSKKQSSTEDQVRVCIEYAATHKIYLPPEFVSADEAVTGRRLRRDGLKRTQLIMSNKLAQVLLVFKASRLFRQAHKGYQFFQELVDIGARAISITQNIDTREAKSWKLLINMHGFVDEMLIDAISDHAREGLKGLFMQGYVVGALPVGFRPIPVANAPLTKKGLPRMKRGVVAEHAALIRQHYLWMREGMPVREGWKRWVAAGGPVDPRTDTKQPTCQAYRRMFDNTSYTGVFFYGRKRNQWSCKRDGVRQILQPNENIVTFRSEELRIVSDELFFAVQKRFLAEERGKHRVRRKDKPLHLWDLVTEVFWCPFCKRRMTQYGASGCSMHCPMPECPQKGSPRRADAVRNVCGKLEELIRRDTGLVEEIICSAQSQDAEGDQTLKARIDDLTRQISRLTEKIDMTFELAGEGTQTDKEEIKKKIRTFQQERGSKQLELTRLQKASGPKKVVTPDEVKQVLAGFAKLLEDGAAGNLGADVIYTAADVFRKLVGGRIHVYAERRPGRKRTSVRGTFVPSLLNLVRTEVGLDSAAEEAPTGNEAEVWLRTPPRIDRNADEVKRLHDEMGLGFRAIGKVLKCGSGNASLCYRRWYVMRGLPIPPKSTKTGRPRKLAG